MKNKNLWPGWEMGECLGKGGFGRVYEIHREVFGDVERKALKIITIPKDDNEVEFMRIGGMDDESISNTFYNHVGDIIREYKIMSKLQDNPNIVHCDDFRYTRHEDGLGWDIYIKMELLTPLLKVIDRVKSETAVIQLGIDLCNALKACQEYDLIHRDIKPQNIFLSPKGAFKLGDFGISRTMEHTTMATLGGSPPFMAPEVARGEKYGKTVDIYSLGMVLYWLLNEYRTPFLPLPPKTYTYKENEAAFSRRISGEPLPPPKNGSTRLISVVLKACSYNPNNRYQSAQEMMSALQMINGTCGNSIVDNEKTILDEDVQRRIEQEKRQKEDGERKGKEQERFEQLRKEEELNPKKEKEQRERERTEERRRLEEEYKRKEEEQKRESAGETEQIRKQRGEEDKRKKNLIIAMGVCICVLVVVAVLLLPKKDINSDLTETERDIPDGFTLIEGEWENGEIEVAALDEDTLRVQIVDDRPNQHYEDLGTAWTVRLGFQWESYAIHLGSMAHQELLINNGNEYWQNNLHIWQCSFVNGSKKNINESLLNLDIEKNGDTYTAIIQLPEWFDASVYDDITWVSVTAVDPESNEIGAFDHNDVFDWESQELKSNEMQVLEIADVNVTEGYNPYSGFGLNNYGSTVDWNMRIELLNIGWSYMDSVVCSWDDSVISINDKTNIGNTYDDYGWEAACSGLTLWESTFNYEGRDFISIKLPDDKNIEGPQWITLIGKINGLMYSRTIHFTLTYNGDYKTGTGWSISNISMADLHNSKDPKEMSNSTLNEHNKNTTTHTLNHTIAAGAYHSVFIRSDGTVGGAGRETDDRRDVSGWNNIISVEASTNTVGLRADGTVVATGKNGYGQCNVGDWHDIVDIAVNVQHTVGLQSNGRVVAKGNNKLGRCNVSDWTDIVDIAAGEKTTFGLKSNGTVVAVGSNSSGQQNISSWNNITAISSIYRHIVGLKKDGTVVAAGNNSFGQCDLSRWRDIVQVSAGHDFTVGLKSDGTVVAAGSNDHGQCNVEHWTDIVEISAGQYHVIGKRSDGTYVAAGSNGYGQCDVA